MELALQLMLHEQQRLTASARIPLDGQLIGLYGPSGVGKTRLLRCIAGLEPSAQGQVIFTQQPQRIGLVFQDSALFPHLTVRQNLLFALRHAPSQRFSLAEVCDWFELTPLLTRPVQALSGGEQQRVAIGRALLNNPDLLLLDEPVASLDQSRRQQVLSRLKHIQHAYQLPMIMVSHDLTELASYCQQLMVMEQGVLLAHGRLADMLQLLAERCQQDSLAILQGVIQRAEDGQRWLMDCGQQQVCLRLADDTSHSAARLVIPAEQVGISLQPLDGVSELNQLRVTLVAILDNVAGQTRRLRLQLGEQWLLADISSWQCEQLQLHVGASLWAHFNGMAVSGPVDW